MYCTIDDVKRLTGYDVSADTVAQAQFVIEVFTGRVEAQITSITDLALLKRATVAQAAYMKDGGEIVFEQIAASQIGQNSSLTSFKAGDFTSPWIAPLAVMISKRLSWNHSRSIKVGKIFNYHSKSWVTD